MDKTVLFYWSKGAGTRVKILNAVHQCNKKKEPCFLQQIAEKLKMSHVGIKKHVDLLAENGYLKETNPKGKPIYLELTPAGIAVLKEFKKMRCT